MGINLGEHLALQIALLAKENPVSNLRKMAEEKKREFKNIFLQLRNEQEACLNTNRYNR